MRICSFNFPFIGWECTNFNLQFFQRSCNDAKSLMRSPRVASTHLAAIQMSLFNFQPITGSTLISDPAVGGLFGRCAAFKVRARRFCGPPPLPPPWYQPIQILRTIPPVPLPKPCTTITITYHSNSPEKSDSFLKHPQILKSQIEGLFYQYQDHNILS